MVQGPQQVWSRSLMTGNRKSRCPPAPGWPLPGWPRQNHGSCPWTGGAWLRHSLRHL
ncbi:MAG: EspF repeat-containing protein [Desulfotignum sp.]